MDLCIFYNSFQVVGHNFVSKTVAYTFIVKNGIFFEPNVTEFLCPVYSFIYPIYMQSNGSVYGFFFRGGQMKLRGFAIVLGIHYSVCLRVFIHVVSSFPPIGMSFVEFSM